DREPMVHNQQFKATVRRPANLRPVELMAVGLAAARGTIGRKQSVVPVVCYGSGRKQHDSQDNYVAPNRDRASSSAQKPFRALPRVQRRVSRSRKTDEGAGLCDNPLRV